MQSSVETYWSKFASDWSLIGHPLRPSSEDNAIMEQMLAKYLCTKSGVPVHAVMLGVTQEIAAMQWPENTNILAFDREPAIIRALWPRYHSAHAAALCSNWLELPLVEGYADLVVGDGSLTLLSFPCEYQKLARELARVIAPDGIMVLRVYAAPSNRDAVDTIFKDLWDGKIGNFNTFKWRLAMALTEDADFCVSVNEIWEAWNANVDSAEKLAEILGWSLPVVGMIERYRNCTSTKYSFPPLDQVKEVFAPFFVQEEMVIPSYQDGERYPTVCFRKI